MYALISASLRIEQIRRNAEAPSTLASYIMYSSTVKSLRRQVMDTDAAISFRQSSLPRNHLGSVRTEMHSAPAVS